MFDKVDFAQIVNYALTIVVLRYVIPWLKNHAKAAGAAAQVDTLDAKATLLDKLQEFLFNSAAAVAEKKFPELAGKISAKKITSPAQVKEELYSWGGDLYAEVIRHFSTMNVDIVKQLGAETIDRLIEVAANNVSPFPGKETARAILQTGVADQLINQGVDFAKQTATDATCKACIPPCAECPLKGSQAS